MPDTGIYQWHWVTRLARPFYYNFPLSVAALPPIWSCHKTRGDRFGVLQSRDQPGQTLCTLRALTSDDTDISQLASLARKKREEDPGLPIRTVNYRGKQTFNFPRASTTKNQIRGTLSQACQTWGADIKVGRDILYEHVGYRPRRRTPIDDKTARAVGYKLEGAFYPRHASTERRNDSGAKQTNVKGEKEAGRSSSPLLFGRAALFNAEHRRAPCLSAPLTYIPSWRARLKERNVLSFRQRAWWNIKNEVKRPNLAYINNYKYIMHLTCAI